jgi:integrase
VRGTIQRVSNRGKDGKLSEQWRARYVAPDKKERSKRFRTKADAENWLNINNADVAKGMWVDPALGKESFRSYATKWKDSKVDVDVRTKINVNGRIDNHAIPHFGDTAMASIQPADVRTFVAKLAASGKSPSTVKAIFLTTSQVFAQAMSDGLIGRTPCRDIKLPVTREGEDDATQAQFLTPEQVDDLANAIGDRYRAMVYTAAYSGLRAGELLALKPGALTLGDLGGSIAITGAVREVGGRLVPGRTKTRQKRDVAIPRFLAAMLTEHMQTYPGDFVFTSREGSQIYHRNWYRRHFQPAVAKARETAIAEGREDEAIPAGLRWHDLRHTCAAILIANGRHLQEVKEHLGHSTIRVTSDSYAHLYPAARAAITESLDAAFDASGRRIPAHSAETRPMAGLRLVWGGQK